MTLAIDGERTEDINENYLKELKERSEQALVESKRLLDKKTNANNS